MGAHPAAEVSQQPGHQKRSKRGLSSAPHSSL